MMLRFAVRSGFPSLAGFTPCGRRFRSSYPSRAATYIPSLRRMAEHLSFAMWLTAVSRPEVLVELGTLRGTSNRGFCQAIAALGLSTYALAVDSWEGDLQDGRRRQTAVQVTPQFRVASARPGTDHAAERSLAALRTPSIRCLAILSICSSSS